MFNSRGVMTRAMTKAVESGDLQAVKKLITKHAGDLAFLNAVDAYGNTALLKALRYGKLDIAEYLLTCAGINANHEAWKDKFEPGEHYRCAPLNLAIRKGYIGIAETMLGLPNINVNNYSFYVLSVMDTAILGDHAGIVSKLLCHPNFKFDWLDEQHNIFTWAYHHLSRASFNQLITHDSVRIQSNVPVNDYFRSLSFSYDLQDILDFLLTLPDFKVDMSVWEGDSALLTSMDVVQLFLRIPNFDWNAKYQGGKNIVMLAVERNLPELVELLLQGNKIDVNARDDEGNTALILAAAHHDNAAIINQLLAHGADRTLTNKHGCNACTQAKLAGHDRIKPLLKIAPYSQEEYQQFILWRQQCAVSLQNKDFAASSLSRQTM